MTSDVELERLEVATHEVAHAVAWHEAGFPIREVRIRAGWRGRVKDGFVDPDLTGVTTRDQARAALVGYLAGCEAGRRWSDENKQRHRERHCSHDFAIVHQALRQDPLSRGLKERDLRHAARKLVGRHWTKILTLADQLAARGTITM